MIPTNHDSQRSPALVTFGNQSQYIGIREGMMGFQKRLRGICLQDYLTPRQFTQSKISQSESFRLIIQKF